MQPVRFTNSSASQTSDNSELALQVCESISEIENNGWLEDWQELARASGFVFHDARFYRALESSGSLGRRTGWFPRLVVAANGPRLVAALPLFLKSNSYGEYIFDWSWASAAHRAGLEYYPKLVAAIPFTPATGPKFLLPRENSEPLREALTQRARDLAQAEGAHSLHFLFPTAEEASQLEQQGFLIRHSFQYHWKNQGWGDFEEFLGALRAKRRQEIRRERAAAAKLPLTIETLTGSELRPEHAESIYELYLSTASKMGGHAYLTRDFFRQLFSTMPERIVLVIASDHDRVVAGSFNMISGTTLYGRYWGCLDEYRHLHFELCYYRTIEWALANGCELFEAGAQGEHKFNRGFTPSLTLSAHQLEHRDLREAVADFIAREKAALEEVFAEYRAHDPFKRGPG